MCNVYVNDVTEEFCESITKTLKNEIVYCEKVDKRSFVARFIGLKYPLLVFEVRSGRTITNDVNDIVLMRKYECV